MGGVVKAVGSAAKMAVNAPFKAASTLGKLGIESMLLPATLTTKALATLSPGMFGPLDRKLGQLKGLAKAPLDLAEKAATALPNKAIDVSTGIHAKIIDAPLNLAGSVLGIKPPFTAN
jgi:hypothetical protein